MIIFIQIFIGLMVLLIVLNSLNSRSTEVVDPLSGSCVINNKTMSISESMVTNGAVDEVTYYLDVGKPLENKVKIKSIINQVEVNIYQDNKQLYHRGATSDKQWAEMVLEEPIKYGVLEIRLSSQEMMPIEFFSDFIENIKIGELRLDNAMPAMNDMMYFIVSFMGLIFSILISVIALSLIKKKLNTAISVSVYGGLILICSLYALFNKNTYLISLFIADAFIKSIIIELLGIATTMFLFKILSSYSKREKMILKIKRFLRFELLFLVAYLLFCTFNAVNIYALHLVMGINYMLLVVCLFPVIGEQKAIRHKMYLLVIFLTPVIGALVQMIGTAYEITALSSTYNVSLLSICFFLFVPLLDLINNNLNMEVRLKSKENELLQAQTLIMLSQIQPHFLYNTLDSIRYLCKRDPLLASDTILRFSQFLRRNLDSLKQKELVSFEKELEHLQNYLAIEKLRFDDRLNIEYSIETSDFKLPSLTVQPLVENCVKYGVTKKREGGTVIIKTLETPTSYKIIISDDGVGFDPKQKQDDGRTHIGLNNVCFRLEQQCNGSLLIESKKGVGTRFTIIIPKEKNECNSN